jgi:hypothetical protein
MFPVRILNLGIFGEGYFQSTNNLMIDENDLINNQLGFKQKDRRNEQIITISSINIKNVPTPESIVYY